VRGILAFPENGMFGFHDEFQQDLQAFDGNFTAAV
jgi:hypothetical protein